MYTEKFKCKALLLTEEDMKNLEAGILSEKDIDGDPTDLMIILNHVTHYNDSEARDCTTIGLVGGERYSVLCPFAVFDTIMDRFIEKQNEGSERILSGLRSAT